METKLYHKNFVLTRGLVDSSGDAIWRVIPTSESSEQFVIHVRSNNSLYVTIFKHKHKSKNTKTDIHMVTNALRMLCKHLESQGGPTPTIWIKPPNKFLFTAATRAGLKVCGPKRSLLKFN